MRNLLLDRVELYLLRALLLKVREGDTCVRKPGNTGPATRAVERASFVTCYLNEAFHGLKRADARNK